MGFDLPIASIRDDDATNNALESMGAMAVSLYNGSGSDISAKDLVAFDLSDSTYQLGRSLKTSTTTADDPICIGFALEDIPDGKWGKVAIKGFVKDANVATGVTAGSAIQAGTTAGRAVAAGAATERSLGVVLETAASNVADVWLY